MKKIKSTVIDELSKTFSFEARQFGQDITLSEVMTTIQKVKGIIAVDVDKLFETGKRPRLNHVLSSSLQLSTQTKKILQLTF